MRSFLPHDRALIGIADDDRQLGWIERKGGLEANPAPEAREQGHCLGTRSAGGAEQDFAASPLGKAGGFLSDGDAPFRPVGTAGQVGNREPRRGRGQHCAWRGHAVEQAKDFQLGLKLIRNAVNGQIRLAYSVFNGGDEGHPSAPLIPQNLRPEFLAQKFLSMMQVARHHVFQQHPESATGCLKSQPATEGARSDNGDCLWQRLGYLTAKAWATSSALGLA